MIMAIFRSINRRFRHIPIPVLLLWVTLYSLITTILIGMLLDEFEEPTQSDLQHSVQSAAHIQEVPSYYPMKTKGLFTRYIVLDDACSFEMKRRSDFDSTTSATLKEEQKKKYSTTDMLSESSPISMDFESMKCEKLMTLHHNILWRMSFDILVDLEDQDDAIKEFEVYVTSNKASEKSSQETRSVGRVFDGEIIGGSNDKLRRKHHAEFHVFDPLQVHQIEVYYSHSDKYFDYEEKGDADVLNYINSEWAERKKRDEDASFAELFEAIRNHSDLVGVDLGQEVFERAQRGYQAKYFIGSALFDTPFQITILSKSDFKPPHHFCFERQFHFDVYHQGDGNAVVDEKALTMKHKGSLHPIYTMNRRIGRFENISSSTNGGYGVWVEPDCIWSIDHFYPFEKVDAIFSDGFHLRFTGDSNHQHSVTAANHELVPGVGGVNVADYTHHNISFEWFFFRGSRRFRLKEQDMKYSDGWMDKILDHSWDCRKAWALYHENKDGTYNYPPNFSSLNVAMWPLDRGIHADIQLLAEGIGFLTKECHEKYPEFTKTALFWRESYAIAMRRAPKITHRRRRLILANGQAEWTTEVFLKELEGQITGVLLDFERTYARQWKAQYDSVHIEHSAYKYMNHDMFNEIFRYIPAVMHSRCFKRFDDECKEAFAKRK